MEASRLDSNSCRQYTPVVVPLSLHWELLFAFLRLATKKESSNYSGGTNTRIEALYVQVMAPPRASSCVDSPGIIV